MWSNSFIYQNLFKTTFPEFFDTLILWFKKSDFSINKYCTDQIMDRLQDICDAYQKLCNEAKQNKQKEYVYQFRSLNEIKYFIQQNLHLSDQHVKLAWFIKGVFFAHKKFVHNKLYNTASKRWPFYYTLLYHVWFCKGRIPARKCLTIKYC